MALETQYIVATHSEYGYPVITRCILVDGVEVSRGEADFIEIKAAYPVIIEEYFDAISAWAQDLGIYMGNQSEFTVDVYVKMHSASRFFYDFLQKYDYASIHYQMPQFQAPPAEEVQVEPVVEETPVTE